MRDKICMHRMTLHSRHEIHSCIEFSRERLVSSLGRREQHDMQCGQLWAWWLEAQELDFQGAEGGECRDSACPLFLVSGKEKGGR